MEIMPDPKIMLLVFIVFLITMFLLNKFVFQPLLSFMDDRENKVIKDLELVSQDDSELVEIEKQIKEVIGKAKAEAHQIKEEQLRQVRELANAKIAKVQAENKDKMDSFVASLHENKEQMKRELRDNFGDIESLILAKIKNA